MGLFFAVLLRALHFFYAAALAVKSFWKRQTGVSPQPLTASRRRLPKHLAIVFAVAPSLQEEVAQDVLTESVVDAVTWCQAIGVQKLTLYEERDLLSNCVPTIRGRLHVQSGEDCSTGSETEYPLTPPPSDYAESRPLSPDFRSEESTFRITTIRVGASPCGDELRKSSPTLRKHRKQRTSGDSDISDILVCFASRESAKPAIANVAQDLARNERSRKSSPAYADGPFEISVPELGRLLEDDDALSAPDFMIVHHVESLGYVSKPLELHGFPPWHIRLTEIYHSKPHKSIVQKWLSPHWPLAFPLDENTFRASLDEFASAEMRFGK